MLETSIKFELLLRQVLQISPSSFISKVTCRFGLHKKRPHGVRMRFQFDWFTGFFVAHTAHDVLPWQRCFVGWEQRW